jgi:hypothetical protein
MTGLLYSQIGYEQGLPVRVVVRDTSPDFLSDGAQCRIGERSATLQRWGALWGEFWWVAEFPTPQTEGVFDVVVVDHGNVLLSGDGLRIGRDVLWNATARLAAFDMLERRARLAKAPSGWQDAGSLWQENNSHSAMVLGLLDVVERGSARFAAECLDRVYAQICNGCDYLCLTQEASGSGGLVHDLLGSHDVVLPNDAAKAVVAWRRAARLLPAGFAESRARYVGCANAASTWLASCARPMGDVGFTRRQRGLPDDFVVPVDEWLTRDIVFFCWGAFEAAMAGESAARDECASRARQIAARQFTEGSPEAGYFGHFREFASCPHSEKAWVHSIAENRFGADAGGTYPNFLLPFVEMLRAWPDHPDADLWRTTLDRFAYGFLLPVCRANPFHIVPQGIFGNEGPVWFAGLWHGMNAVYGLTAALALDLAEVLDDPAFVEIAHANLQWIAGLNAGVTRESLFGCHMTSMDLPPGVAEPFSMVCGVGRQWAGTWLNTRGVICNGFSTGHQFQFDVDPTQANDAPSSFTDEDWIPHSAAWLSGIVRLPEATTRPDTQR